MYGQLKYNIHGILKVESNIEGLIPPVFKVDYLDSLDLSVFILGTSEFKNLCKADGLKFGRFYLKNLSRHTIVYYIYNKIIGSVNYLLNDSVAPHCNYFVTNTLIPLKFLQKGYSIIHGACLDYRGDGLLIIAPSNTGKTLTALLLAKAGFGYLSDDLTITDGLHAYSYPSDCTISSTTLKILGIDIKINEHLKLKSRQIINKIPFLAPCLDGIRIPPNRIIKNLKLRDATMIKYIFFLDPMRDGIQVLDEETSFRRLLNASYEVKITENYLLSTYLYEYPDDACLTELIELRNTIYRRVCSKSEAFLLGDTKREFAKYILRIVSNEGY
ncbi:MAG: hypothetical protein QXO15_10530 [Nitrososphaerota archaeon]